MLSNEIRRKIRNVMKQEIKKYQSEDNSGILSAAIICINFLLVSSVVEGSARLYHYKDTDTHTNTHLESEEAFTYQT